MSTLDNLDATYTNLPATKTGLRMGLIGGLIMILYALLGFVFNLNNPSNLVMSIVFGLLSFVLLIGILVYSVRSHRKEQGGYIKFGKAFLVCLITAVIMGLLGSAFNYIYLQFIDPNYMENMVDGLVSMYEQMGLTEEQIDTAIAQVQNNMKPRRQLITSLATNLIGGSIIALIIAAIMKKNPPQEAV